MACSVYDVLTPDWLKSTFLLGVDLTLDDGSAYPDAIFEQALRHAVQLMEGDLGITIDPMIVKGERHDAVDADTLAYWIMKPDRRPIMSIDKMEIRYGQYTPAEIPDEWINVLSYSTGQVQLIPIQRALGSHVFSGNLIHLLGGLYLAEDYLPGYFSLDYTAGFACPGGQVVIPDGEFSADIALPVEVWDQYTVDFALSDPAFGATGPRSVNRGNQGFTVELDTPPAGGDVTVTWQVNSIPGHLSQAIGLVAASLPLDVAGDLIAGAGIASYSVSLDGLSQNVNTTSSATNSGYGARVLQFAKELKALMPVLRGRYRLPSTCIF